MQKNHHNTLVPMGRIVGAFGIKGWVKIKPDTQEYDALSKYLSLYIHINEHYKPYTLELSFVQNGVLHVKFNEISDRDTAQQLKGVNVAVAREDFPVVDVGEYYWVDLIGLDVYNNSNNYLGKVTSLMETGANSVLVVETTSQSRELIPFVDMYVSDVSLDTKKITVDWELGY